MDMHSRGARLLELARQKNIVSNTYQRVPNIFDSSRANSSTSLIEKDDVAIHTNLVDRCQHTESSIATTNNIYVEQASGYGDDTLYQVYDPSTDCCLSTTTSTTMIEHDILDIAHASLLQRGEDADVQPNNEFELSEYRYEVVQTTTETALSLFSQMCHSSEPMEAIVPSSSDDTGNPPHVLIEAMDVGAEVVCDGQVEIVDDNSSVDPIIVNISQQNAEIAVHAESIISLPHPYARIDHDYHPDTIRPPAVRKRATNYTKRLLGDEYIGFQRSQTGEVTQGVVRDKRCMQPRCRHGEMKKITGRTFLCIKVSENKRKKLHDEFWALPSWEAKKAYIKPLTNTRVPIKRRQEIDKSRKSESHDCFMPSDEGNNVKVCRELFLATFSLKENMFRGWVRDPELHQENTDDPELNPQQINIPAAHSRVTSKQKRQLVSQWLEEIPKVPSHYCRANTSRVYVENTFRSVSYMHEVYSAWCRENAPGSEPVSRQIFAEVLDGNKISIHQPRKDQCDTCYAFKVGQIDNATYVAHREKQQEARDAKKAAKESASENKLVVTMDVQSTLLAPNLQASAVYYKMKLQIHNLMFYSLNDGDVTLYVWHEGNGGVTSNEFVSCMIDFIKSQTTKYSHVTLISDGCGYQNRNKVLSSALSNAAETMNVTIEQLILEKGHTMMEADSVHSTLQRHFTPPLYSPADYLAQMRVCRPHQPYKVKYLDYTFFKEYESLQSNVKSIRPGVKSGDSTVCDLRGLLYLPSGEIQYKLRHTEEFQTLPQPRKSTQQNCEAQIPPRLFKQPPKIKKDKFTHLQQLKEVIPAEYHLFYDTLTHH